MYTFYKCFPNGHWRLTKSWQSQSAKRQERSLLPINILLNVCCCFLCIFKSQKKFNKKDNLFKLVTPLGILLVTQSQPVRLQLKLSYLFYYLLWSLSSLLRFPCCPTYKRVFTWCVLSFHDIQSDCTWETLFKQNDWMTNTLFNQSIISCFKNSPFTSRKG